MRIKALLASFLFNVPILLGGFFGVVGVVALFELFGWEMSGKAPLYYIPLISGKISAYYIALMIIIPQFIVKSIQDYREGKHR